jgi:glucosamine--fructose-6-phosphate aminotransferase (isomerizing)
VCGIVGMIHDKAVMTALVPALRRLEYRGYDSAGIALLDQGQLTRHRVLGVLDQLTGDMPMNSQAKTAMGHTRWATHGEPSVRNAHPHFSHRVAIVHNGIVDNFQTLKTELLKQGYAFSSDTDTEVIAHLIDSYLERGHDPEDAFSLAIQQLEGNFAIACMISHWKDALLVARRGTPPLLVGKGIKGYSIGSDALGLVDISDDVAYLTGDSWGIVTQNSATVYDFSKDPRPLNWQKQMVHHQNCEQGNYAHFMRKEIDEQPDVIARLLSQPTPALAQLYPDVTHVSLLGCGTSFYAAWIGKYVLEHHYTVMLELASEFSYRQAIMSPGVTLALSQSGETADTLKAVAYAKNQRQHLISVVNAPYSSLARCSDHVLDMQAGPEIGVASTKAFTAQLWLLFALAGITPDRAQNLPQRMQQTLQLAPDIRRWATAFADASNMLYLGRGVSYPVALEGALKMKELSYIHAEGLAAGELKHGSLALVDATIPIIFLAPHDDIFDKTLGNIHEIMARKGRLYVITDRAGAEKMPAVGVMEYLILPDAPDPIFNPFIQTMALQLLAYYTALARGCSIDKPRNLAKSVTVE